MSTTKTVDEFTESLGVIERIIDTVEAKKDELETAQQNLANTVDQANDIVIEFEDTIKELYEQLDSVRDAVEELQEQIKDLQPATEEKSSLANKFKSAFGEYPFSFTNKFDNPSYQKLRLAFRDSQNIIGVIEEDKKVMSDETFTNTLKQVVEQLTAKTTTKEELITNATGAQKTAKTLKDTKVYNLVEQPVDDLIEKIRAYKHVAQKIRGKPREKPK